MSDLCRSLKPRLQHYPCFPRVTQTFTIAPNTHPSQGEVGDKFYIIERGRAYVYKN